MAPIAAGVLLAHVGDHGLGVSPLDLERGDQRVLGFDGYLIRLAPDLDPEGVAHGHACSRRDPSESRLPHRPRQPGSRGAMAGPFPCSLRPLAPSARHRTPTRVFCALAILARPGAT